MYTGDTNTLIPFKSFLDDSDEFYVDVSKNGGGVHLKIDNVLMKLKEIKNNGTKVFLMHIDDKEYVKKVANNEFFIV